MIKYQNQELFEHDYDQDKLNCPYCHRSYSVICPRLRARFNQMYEEDVRELDQLIVRCISCDLYNPEYPFKRTDRPFELNQQQKEVIEGLYKELTIMDDDSKSNNETHDLFLVEGYAGTGKTTVVTDLVKYPEIQNLKICFSAPTNNALNVLYDKLRGSEDTDTATDSGMRRGETSEETNDKRPDFTTVFKLMGSKFSINQYGDEVFDTSNFGDNAFSKYDLIFIDEVSMVTEKQANQILNIIKDRKSVV